MSLRSSRQWVSRRRLGSFFYSAGMARMVLHTPDFIRRSSWSTRTYLLFLQRLACVDFFLTPCRIFQLARSYDSVLCLTRCVLLLPSVETFSNSRLQMVSFNKHSKITATVVNQVSQLLTGVACCFLISIKVSNYLIASYWLDRFDKARRQRQHHPLFSTQIEAEQMERLSLAAKSYSIN